MRSFHPALLLVAAVLAAAGAASHLTACATKAADKTCNPDDDKSELQACGTRPGGMVKGIDVSSVNGDIDWAQVKKAGYGWAYAQVSDGLEADTKFAANWKGIKAAGMVRGAYQYFYPKQDVQKQVDLYLKALKDGGKIGVGDLPPVLDLEETESLAADAIVDAATAWIDAVEKATSRKVMVLTNPAMAKTIGTKFKDHGFWVAQYRNDCPDLPTTWKSWSWDFWTYSERLKVAGVTEGTVYSAFFQGTLNDMKVLTLEASPDAGSPASDAGPSDASTSPDVTTGGNDGGSATRDSGTTTKDSGTKDSGSSQRDSGSGGSQDSGGSTSTSDSGPGDDAGGSGSVGGPPEESPTPTTPPAKKTPSGPRTQREEDPKADPCAKKDDQPTIE